VVRCLAALGAPDEIRHGLLYRVFRFIDRGVEEDQALDLLGLLGGLERL
jgi:hypothetical protein